MAGDPQVRRFFLLVLLTVVGTMAQDVLLEPYGALVLGMPAGDTTRLTMFWGMGVLAAMLGSGTVLIPRFGHLPILRVGLVASVAAFGGVIAIGLVGRPGWFRVLVLGMGLGTGLAGAGILTGAIHFTTAVRAGMLMGLWGMANLVGKALGSVLGGGAVDLLQAWTGAVHLSYAAVFAAEMVLLLAALGLSFGVDVERSAARAEEGAQLAEVLGRAAE